MGYVDTKKYRFFPEERNLIDKANTFIRLIEEFDSHGSALESSVRAITKDLKGEVVAAIRDEIVKREETQRVANQNFKGKMTLAASEYQLIVNDMNVQRVNVYFEQKKVPNYT